MNYTRPISFFPHPRTWAAGPLIPIAILFLFLIPIPIPLPIILCIRCDWAPDSQVIECRRVRQTDTCFLCPGSSILGSTSPFHLHVTGGTHPLKPWSTEALKPRPWQPTATPMCSCSWRRFRLPWMITDRRPYPLFPRLLAANSCIILRAPLEKPLYYIYSTWAAMGRGSSVDFDVAKKPLDVVRSFVRCCQALEARKARWKSLHSQMNALLLQPSPPLPIQTTPLLDSDSEKERQKVQLFLRGGQNGAKGAKCLEMHK